MEYLPYLKALHIIFVVTWFCGLFYSVRLFIYHTEAENKDDLSKSILQKQYKIMSKRLWYLITWPSAILTSIFAFLILYISPSFLLQTWMWVKLSFVFLLYLYQFGCHSVYKQLQKDVVKYSPLKLRFWNEIPTLILFAIVFIVELQSAINWIWIVVGILVIGIVLMTLIKMYKKSREKTNIEHSKKFDDENSI